MKTRFSTKFFLEKRKNQSGEVIKKDMPIRMYFSFEGKRLEYYSGYRIDELKWDFENQKVRPNCFDNKDNSASKINSELNKLKGKIETLYEREKILLNGLEVPLKELQTKFKLEVNDKKEKPQEVVYEGKKTFKFGFDQFYASIESELAPSTLKSFRYTLKTILEFAGNDCFLEEFNFEKLIKFKAWYLKSHAYNTYANFNKRTKQILNYAYDMNWISSNEFNKVKAVEQYPEPIYPTWEEFNTLMNFMPKEFYLQEVKDVFVAQCFIGCRYEDLKTFNKNHINNGTLCFVTSKDKKSLKVPLHEEVLKIINKYDVKIGEKLFPVLSNKDYNLQLKILAKKAGLERVVATTVNNINCQIKIDEKISTHWARKIFIGSHINEFKTAEPIIKSMTGHSENSRSFHRYYKVDEKTKEDAIKNMKKSNSKKK